MLCPHCPFSQHVTNFAPVCGHLSGRLFSSSALGERLLFRGSPPSFLPACLKTHQKQPQDTTNPGFPIPWKMVHSSFGTELEYQHGRPQAWTGPDTLVRVGCQPWYSVWAVVIQSKHRAHFLLEPSGHALRTAKGPQSRPDQPRPPSRVTLHDSPLDLRGQPVSSPPCLWGIESPKGQR